MACLVPHFKCPSSDAHFNSRTCHFYTRSCVNDGPLSIPPRARDPVCFRGQCVLASTMTVVDVEKLKTPSLEAPSTFLTAVRPFTYIGGTSPLTKMDFELALATKPLLISEESIIATAAAEAVSLARVAAEVAKDAAKMVENSPSKLEKPDDFLYEANILQGEVARLMEVEPFGTDECSTMNKTQLDITLFPYKDGHNSNSTKNESKLQQLQHSKSIAVRSERKTVRRSRRARAAEKAASSVVSVKSGSYGRKRCVAFQGIDHSDPLCYLRATTSASKLLTTTEELELSDGIQVSLKLERLQDELAKRYGGPSTFAQWAAAAGLDQKTLRKCLNYGALCKDKMIKSNIRLVISIAKSYQGVGMNLQDLVQEGCRGLVKGVEKFDASKGFKFSTYAHWWIKQAIRKCLSDQSRTIRLPVHMVEATHRVREARKQLYSENGRYPDNEEVAEATGLSMKRLNAVLLIPKAPRSLDQRIGINENIKPSEVIAHPDAQTAEDTLIKRFMKQELDKVLDSLSLREKQVVKGRFGLGDGRIKTLQEMGELMGVSRERIRQIESCAFRKLENERRLDNLQRYLVS